MRSGWFLTFKSSFLSVLLHIAVVVLLVFSFSMRPDPVIKPIRDINIVEAVSVDKKQVEDELAKLKKLEQEKQDQEKKRISELEKQAQNARNKREQEEKRLKEIEQKKEAEQKKKQAEAEELARIKKEQEELEKQRKVEEQKKKEAETERKRLEEEAAQKKKEAEEAEKKRKEEEARRIKEAEEKKRKEEEARLLKEQIEAEERALQEQADARLINKVAADIQDKVARFFNKANLPGGLQCKLRVKLLPGGEVISVTVDQSSGNDIFDRRAVNAVQKASPLPVPGDLETFERLDLRDITFTFTP